MRRGPVIAVPGSGDQRITLIPLNEVVDALVAADARDAVLKGTWELGGTPVPMREIVTAAGVRARVVFSRALSPIPKEAAAYLGSDILVDGSAAREALGL
jgi:nucleoside-diphosphate-sugar epimerase